MIVDAIVAESRGFDNYAFLENKLDFFFSLRKPNSIICGMARGADLLGLRYAEDRDIPVRVYPADWNTYGRAAGYIRNEHMAAVATHLVAFWDGRSPGTRHMIDIGQREGLIIRVVRLSA